MVRAVLFDMYETLITQFRSPVCFCAEMSAVARVPMEHFRKLWDPTEDARATGGMTFEDALRYVLNGLGKYSDETMNTIVTRRKNAKRDCFLHLDSEIIPLLTALHKENIRIGVVSNCFSEEAEVIRESVLFPHFDAVCLSCEEGVKKPDPEIFMRCVKRLDVRPEECIFVGDGGSSELEASHALGMTPVQARWYYENDLTHPYGLRKIAECAETPMRVMEILNRINGK